MIEYIEENDNVVELREEALVTRQPGYIATEQAVHDIAAERRWEWFKFNRIMWSILAFVELLLFGRFLLRFIAANPESGFAMLMYGITGVIVEPFNGLVATPMIGGWPLEITTLIAMAVYALGFWVIAYAIRLVLSRPRA